MWCQVVQWHEFVCPKPTRHHQSDCRDSDNDGPCAMQMCYVAGLRPFQEGWPVGLVGRRKVWGQPVAHKSLPWHGICLVPLQFWWWEMVRSSLLFMYSQLSRGCALIFSVQMNPPLFRRAGKDLRNRVRNSYTPHRGSASVVGGMGGRDIFGLLSPPLGSTSGPHGISNSSCWPWGNSPNDGKKD